ncbi:MAG: hypothetical protein AAFM92_09830 [Pseudomonadota bacterium]
MAKNSPDIAESIQLAIDAASAANDSAAELDGVRGQTVAAADRLDALGKSLKPLMLGTVAGAIVAIGIGGAVYLHALSRLGAATATQEATAQTVAESIASLSARLDSFEGLDAQLTALTEARSIDEALIRGAVAAELQIVKEAEVAEMAATLPSVLSQVTQATEEEHADTRDLVVSSMSDLQLALTRIIAEGPATVAGAGASARASAPAVAPAAATPAAPQAAPAQRRPAAVRRPEPNPFSYP